jgi:integrase
VFGERPRLRVRRQYYRGQLKLPEEQCRATRAAAVAGNVAKALGRAACPRLGPMFASRNGTRLQDRNVRRVLDKVTHAGVRGRHGRHAIVPALAGADLEWIGFHSFRHTCASILLDSGKNIRQVAAWLGHEDPAFTLRTYAHLMDAGLGDATFFDHLANGIPNEEVGPKRGNSGATQHPGTAANETAPTSAEIRH